MLILSTEQTPQQKLDKCVVTIMNEPRYVGLSGVLMIGTKKVVEGLDTACTDGRDEMYGAGFIEELSEPELRYIILHECRHKMYRHLITWKHLHEICAESANKACDYVINLELDDENRGKTLLVGNTREPFAVMPMGKYKGLVDEKFRGMNSAEVFDILYEKKKQEEEDKQGGGEEGEGQPGEGQPGGEEGQPDQPEETGFDEHDWDGAKEMSPTEQATLEEEVERAIQQGAANAGKVKGAGNLLAVEKLLRPKIDPRALLREFITQTCSGQDDATWRRPHRRGMAMGIMRPSGVSEKIGEIVLAIDTSISCMSPEELTKFLSIAKQIVDTTSPDAVRILYWGTSIAGDELYGVGGLPTSEMIKSTKPRCAGGTTVSCVTEYIEENKIDPQAVVVLTDGELGGAWGTWKHPVLWLITDKRSKQNTPTVGKFAHVKF
jgi:predicted metal-dependent peptidase